MTRTQYNNYIGCGLTSLTVQASDCTAGNTVMMAYDLNDGTTLIDRATVMSVVRMRRGYARVVVMFYVDNLYHGIQTQQVTQYLHIG